MFTKSCVLAAIVGTASGFTLAPTLPSTGRVTSCTQLSMVDKYPEAAPSSAPPADLFNIWRNDYMLSPQQAASEASERQSKTIFDGVLPPFSQGFNQERGSNLGKPTLRGEGPTFLLSTSNPPSAYDAKPNNYTPRKGILPSTVSGLTPEQVLAAKQKGISPAAPKKKQGTTFSTFSFPFGKKN